MKKLNHRELNALFRESDIMCELAKKAESEQIRQCYIESCISRFLVRNDYKTTNDDFNRVSTSLSISLIGGMKCSHQQSSK